MKPGPAAAVADLSPALRARTEQASSRGAKVSEAPSDFARLLVSGEMIAGPNDGDEGRELHDPLPDEDAAPIFTAQPQVLVLPHILIAPHAFPARTLETHAFPIDDQPSAARDTVAKLNSLGEAKADVGAAVACPKEAPKREAMKIEPAEDIRRAAAEAVAIEEPTPDAMPAMIRTADHPSPGRGPAPDREPATAAIPQQRLAASGDGQMQRGREHHDHESAATPIRIMKDEEKNGAEPSPPVEAQLPMATGSGASAALPATPVAQQVMDRLPPLVNAVQELARLIQPVVPDAPVVRTLQFLLRPEQLGEVRVTLRLAGEAMAVSIETETEDARQALERDRPALDRLLAISGIAIDAGQIDIRLGRFTPEPAAEPSARPPAARDMGEGQMAAGQGASSGQDRERQRNEFGKGHVQFGTTSNTASRFRAGGIYL